MKTNIVIIDGGTIGVAVSYFLSFSTHVEILVVERDPAYELASGQANTLKEEEILIEHWRVHYNKVRPHSSLNWYPPATESLLQFNEIGMIN